MKIKINTIKIHEKLVERGLNYLGLSINTKINKSTISRMMKKKYATPIVINRLAKFFRCKSLDLVDANEHL